MNDIWFDDIQSKLMLTVGERQAIAQWLMAKLTGPEPKAAWPERLQVEERPRLVFLSLSDGRRPATVYQGSGLGLYAATLAALEQAQAQPVVADLRYCKIDVVQSAIACERLNTPRPFKHDRSLYGLAYDRDSQIALLPEELVGQELLDAEQRLDAERLARYLQARPSQAEAWAHLRAASRLTFYRFACTSFATDGRDTWLLYRGHRCFNAIAPSDLLAAAQRGGSYLRRHQTSAGQFTYCYLGSRDRVTIGYNLLRHAGAVSALLDLYEVTGELAFLDSAQGGIDYLLAFSQPSLLAPEVGCCIVENGLAKLGATALAVIALAKYTLLTRQPHYQPQLLQLARHLQAAQQPSGAFLMHRQAYPSGEDTSFVSQRYPSQALLALLYVYRVTQRESWLERAAASAHYLLAIAKRQRPVREDDWLLQGLSELSRDRPHPDYQHQATRIALAILSHQHSGEPQPDYLGSFGDPPRAKTTAAHLEGLCAAYAFTVGNADSNTHDQDALWLASRFLLQLQCEPETVMYLPNPQRARDGFREQLADFTTRLDDVYRTIMGLLAMYRLTCVATPQAVRHH